jgi:lactoylglutathione lyase/methylmalonyl-CoA/ethylmalonyl-CoA epimerase
MKRNSLNIIHGGPIMQSQIKKIDHIGIAVENLDESLDFYQNLLGLSLTGVEEISDQKVSTAFIRLMDTNIELLTPTDDESPIRKLLDKKGKGIHHIALEVDNIETALDELKKKGVDLIDDKPRIGAHNKKIAFIHPRSAGGVLLELCEADKEDK